MEEKWYIVNSDDFPLIWDQRVLYFETEISAYNFLKNWIREIEEDYDWFCEKNGISVVKKNNYNYKNKETLNCTNKRLIYSSGLGELVNA
jgi:hypothetical protein